MSPRKKKLTVGQDEASPGWHNEYFNRHVALDLAGLNQLRVNPGAIFRMGSPSLRRMVTVGVALTLAGEIDVADVAEASGKMILRARSVLERDEPPHVKPTVVPSADDWSDQWLLVALVEARVAKVVRRARREER